MIFPISFELKQQPNLKLLDIVNISGSSLCGNIIDIQNRFFQSLLREPITISLRYFYNFNATSNDKCLKIFLIFNTEIEDVSKRISSALQVSDFHQIYPFQPIEFNTIQSQTLQNLDWVNFLIEIHKSEIINDKGYYLPRPFAANHEHNMVTICEQLSRTRKISPERFLLEITLQPYNNSAESSQWINAIDTLLKVQSQAGNSGKDAIRETVIKGFQYYQTKYSHNPVFTYSIKLLAETENHLSNLAITWLQNATNSDYANYYQNLPILKRGTSEFAQSLQATCEIRISPRSSNHSSQVQKIVNQDIRQVFGSKPLFGDGSTQRSQYIPPPKPPVPPALSNPTTTPVTSNSLDLGNSYALGEPIANQGWNRPQPARIEDFLPLRYLVTFDEFSSFLRVVVPDPKPISGMAILQPSYPTMTAEELFNKYHDFITPDTYIVGLDDNGNVITSSWDETAHRLLAGVPGAGKTNFLRWVLFQFLYANPKRKIYIADFKGVDFLFLADLGVNVNLVTTVEDCETQVETINNEELLVKQQLMSQNKVTKLSTLQKEGVDIDRTLWLIDEAADIAYASSKLKAKIENSLAKYARQGRSPGIQVVYCTQRVSAAVVTPQVTDQCEERVVFRVTASASEIVLDDSSASEIPMHAKGRAILDSPQGRIFINTPFMQNPEGSQIPISATLWKHIKI